MENILMYRMIYLIFGRRENNMKDKIQEQLKNPLICGDNEDEVL